MGLLIMRCFFKLIVPVIALATYAAALAQGPTYNLGRTPTAEESRTCCIPITLDGQGLPPGSGTAQQGAPTNGEWPTYGGDLGSTKYSPLDQIDATNFGDLEIAWRWQSADAAMGKARFGGITWARTRRIEARTG